MTKAHLDASLAVLFRRLSQCINAAFHCAVAESDLTLRQYAVLVTVAENDGLSHGDLVARTGIDRSTMSQLVRRMANKGLLRCVKYREDGRVSAISLTAKGSHMQRTAEPVVKQIEQRILQAIPKEHRDQFLSGLTSIVELDRRASQI